MEFSKTLIVDIFVSKYRFQVILFLNLRLFDVIPHFLPNLSVTGIILDYLHLVSENPRPLLFLEKKKIFGR